MKTTFTRIASLLAVCAIALGLAACSAPKGTIDIETLEEVSGVKVNAENATASESATSAGAVVVSKGDHITVSPFFDKGGVHLTIISSSGKTTAFDDDVSGKELFTLEAKPGQYDVKVTGNGATGWMTVFAESDQQAAELSDSFKETVKQVHETADNANKEVKDAINEGNKIADEIAGDSKKESEQK